MAAAEIIGAVGSALGGAAAAGSAIGGIGSGVKSKKKMKYAANLQYEYGEKAAENAFQRQLALLNKTYEQESYQNRVKQMREAGLSVGLMYGQGAQGGGAGSTSGAPAGATNPNIDAGQGVEQQALGNMSRGGLALIEASRNIASIKNIESQTKLNESAAEKNRAEAAESTERKITEAQSREARIRDIYEAGKQKWIENLQNFYKDSTESSESDELTTYDDLFGFYHIIGKRIENKERFAGVLEKQTKAYEAMGNAEAAQALAALNTERKKYYFQEVMIKAAMADAAGMEAEAKKLATEWETGEYTNWKTWTQIALQTVQTLTSVVGNVTLAKARRMLETFGKAQKNGGRGLPRQFQDFEGMDGIPMAVD